VEAFTDDWTVEIKTVQRREYLVPAGGYQVLRARRLEPAGEELAGKRHRHRKSAPAASAAGLGGRLY
jgi:hypothetical protein